MKRKRRSTNDQIFLSHKIEIYPDAYAKSVLDINFHYKRFLYNLGVERYKLCKNECDEIGEKFWLVGEFFFHSFLQSPRRKKEEFEISDRRIIGKVRDSAAKTLTEVYFNWFENHKHFKEPTFKKKSKTNDDGSFTLPINKTSSGFDIYVDENTRELFFPKLRTYNRHTGYKVYGRCFVSELPRFKGIPTRATFSKHHDRYYVSFTFLMTNEYIELKRQNIIKNNIARVGIDLGVKTFATCVDSVGRKILINNQNKKLVALVNKIMYYEKRMYKCYRINKGPTNNFYRWHDKFRKTLKRLTNFQYNFIQKLTTILCRIYKIIVIEDLYIDEIMNKHKHCTEFNKLLKSMCFWKFRRLLEYKMKIYGGSLVIVDKFFPSSQICSSCGNIQKMSVTNRVYNCPKCGMTLDRDINAATNILNEKSRISVIVG